MYFNKLDYLHKLTKVTHNKLNRNKYLMESNTTILLYVSLIITYQYHTIPKQVVSFQIKHNTMIA